MRFPPHQVQIRLNTIFIGERSLLLLSGQADSLRITRTGRASPTSRLSQTAVLEIAAPCFFYPSSSLTTTLSAARCFCQFVNGSQHQFWSSTRKSLEQIAGALRMVVSQGSCARHNKLVRPADCTPADAEYAVAASAAQTRQTSPHRRTLQNIEGGHAMKSISSRGVDKFAWQRSHLRPALGTLLGLRRAAR